MIYFSFSSGDSICGHVNDSILSNDISAHLDSGDHVTEVQADGDELELCCDLLGRNRVCIFVGDNANEIALNW
jgi:hypothetical protein